MRYKGLQKTQNADIKLFSPVEYLSISRRIFKNSLFFLMLGIIFMTTSCDNNRTVLSVTDIHFNPFHDSLVVAELVQTPYTQWDSVFAQINEDKIAIYNQETTPMLFSLLLKSMKQQGQKEGLSAVIFTGDILAHDFNEQYYKYTGQLLEKGKNDFIYKTMAFVSMKLRHTFPNTPIYFSLGNNDSYKGDYAVVDNGAFLHNTTSLFYKNFINPDADTSIHEDRNNDFYKTYSSHGYYSMKLPTVNNCRIIGLNTNFFSVNYSDTTITHNPGLEEIEWLNKELAVSEKAGERVWLLLHIPPGVNVYSTQHNSSPSHIKVSLQWQDTYNKRYISLLQRYHKTIAASFAGHTHMDDFRLIYNQDSVNKQSLGFIHISPSISPVFGNNPAFQVIEVDANTSNLIETTTHFIDLSEVNPNFKFEYEYTSTYNAVPNMQGLDSLYQRLPYNQEDLDSYINFYSSSSKATGITSSWPWYWCGIGNLTQEDYTTAYKQLQKSN